MVRRGDGAQQVRGAEGEHGAEQVRVLRGDAARLEGPEFCARSEGAVEVVGCGAEDEDVLEQAQFEEAAGLGLG